MKTRSVLFILSAFAFLYSCKKDSNTLDNFVTPTPQPTYGNYSKLAVGNYWIYQRSTLTPAGVYIPITVDSCYISKDTMIGGMKYYVYMEPAPSGSGMIQHLYRDSLHYILDLHKIVFSSIDHTTIFDSGYKLQAPGDTISRYESKMIDIDTTISEPAGSFKSSAFITNYYMYPSYSSGGSVRYIYARHAKDIGIVEESLPFNPSSPNYDIRQIMRYHVN